MDLNEYIRIVPDFPKKGISYKDITPLLQHPQVVTYCVDRFVEDLSGIKIDKVVGIEARGFFFAMLLAQKLNAGFVPVRKAGKLPFSTLQETYALEYGEDRLEVHLDAIQQGEQVLVHDDVLATGGTAEAACKLVEKLGGNIIQCNFLIELSFLKGKNKLSKYNIKSLVHY